jgi:hypothetical protein
MSARFDWSKNGRYEWHFFPSRPSPRGAVPTAPTNHDHTLPCLVRNNLEALVKTILTAATKQGHHNETG